MKCTDCNTLIYPVVGLDIDGTLGQYHQHFVVFLNNYFGRPFVQMEWNGEGEFSDHLGLTKHEYREAKLAYRQGGYKRWMPVYPGAAELVAALHRLDVEVWLCTTRPWLRLDNIDPDTREWCRRTGIEFDGMLFGEDKYAQLLARVGPQRIVAVVDDEVGQLQQAYRLPLPTILRKHDFNFDLRWSPYVRTLTALEAMLAGLVTSWKEYNGWRT